MCLLLVADHIHLLMEIIIELKELLPVRILRIEFLELYDLFKFCEVSISCSVAGLLDDGCLDGAPEESCFFDPVVIYHRDLTASLGMDDDDLGSGKFEESLVNGSS